MVAFDLNFHLLLSTYLLVLLNKGTKERLRSIEFAPNFTL